MDLKNILGVLVAILLLLFLWTGYKSYSLSDKIDEITAKNDKLASQVGDLCLLYTSPSPRDQRGSRMPSSA